MADRCDTPDRLARRGPHEVRGRPAHPSRADQRGDLARVDPVRAGGQHQQRLTVRVEHQRVGDLADLDPQRGSGRRGGGHGVGQHPHAVEGTRRRTTGA